MHDCMLDLETLSVEPYAAVISIGAVMFSANGDSGVLGEAFFRAIDIDDVERVQVNSLHRHVSPTTVRWWMDQTSTAQRESFNNPEAVKTLQALADFESYVKRNDVWALWGNGASFDNVILANLYKVYGLQVPWHFTMDRCYRTMKNLKYGPALPARVGTHHNPLDDARTQAIHLQQITKAIRERDKTIRGTA
jgi:hypothetical protein